MKNKNEIWIKIKRFWFLMIIINSNSPGKSSDRSEDSSKPRRTSDKLTWSYPLKSRSVWKQVPRSAVTLVPLPRSSPAPLPREWPAPIGRTASGRVSDKNFFLSRSACSFLVVFLFRYISVGRLRRSSGHPDRSVSFYRCGVVATGGPPLPCCELSIY